MDWWIWVGIAAVACAFVAFAVRRGWIDLSDKTKRGGGGVMMIGDEVFAPRKHEAQVELDRQSRLPVPSPIPGDGDKGIAFDDDGTDASRPEPAGADRFRGTIRLDVDRD